MIDPGSSAVGVESEQMISPMRGEHEAVMLGPLVRRLTAPNPSGFTHTGTQTYVVGRGELAVIDPGPDLLAHVGAILEATAGERIVAILCTHTHRDHSPASRPLQGLTGAPIVGCAPLAMADEGPRADAAFDRDYRADRIMIDGETLAGPGWTLEAVATPGHTSNHLAFALREAEALFSGDHVMGWSTTVVSPPDGDMTAYMASLDRLLARDERIYYPGHGDPVDNPRRFVAALAGHRRQREGQILRLLEPASRTVSDMVNVMYVGVDSKLHPAARQSVLAHLIDLEARAMVIRDGEQWRIAA